MTDIAQPLPARRRGHWTEYVTSGVAVVVSLISLWIGIGTEDANQKMVAASSWPFLQLDSGNIADDGKSQIRLALVNSGVGPAKVESFQVFWRGKAYRTAQRLLTDCCRLQYYPMKGDGSTPFAGPTTSQVTGYVVRPGEARLFLGLGLARENAVAWHKFDDIRLNKMSFRVCYCSVFDECWTSTLHDLHPTPVKACPVAKVEYLE